MFSSLAGGTSVVRNFLQAEDPLRTLEAFRQMGVEIEVLNAPPGEGSVINNEIIVTSQGLKSFKKPREAIYCGNSGTTMRLLSGVLAGQDFSTTLTGDQSLSGRPMNRVIKPLTEMGAVIGSRDNGYPPLSIEGRSLTPITYNSPVASAQVKSAIMLAGLYCTGTTTVNEPGKSRDHTERMLKSIGADINVDNLSVSITGAEHLDPLEMTVPADLSSAAFFIVAGLIIPGSELMIKNVGINPTRTGIIDILRDMGAAISLENETEISGEPVADIYVQHSVLKGMHIDGDMVLKAIDEFPILCVAAAKAQGQTKISGAHELRVKESDRIAAIAAELKKMNVAVEELADGIIIDGKEDLEPAQAISYGDHRIAMSMLIAGLTARGETVVSDSDCVNTSFPGFMDLISSLVENK
jgi:3-phosphoshikimate 1-carboxyvinyltransferase